MRTRSLSLRTKLGHGRRSRCKKIHALARAAVTAATSTKRLVVVDPLPVVFGCCVCVLVCGIEGGVSVVLTCFCFRRAASAPNRAAASARAPTHTNDHTNKPAVGPLGLAHLRDFLLLWGQRERVRIRANALVRSHARHTIAKHSSRSPRARATNTNQYSRPSCTRPSPGTSRG